MGQTVNTHYVHQHISGVRLVKHVIICRNYEGKVMRGGEGGNIKLRREKILSKVWDNKEKY